jgi:Flp pilus assembly protein TadD
MYESLADDSPPSASLQLGLAGTYHELSKLTARLNDVERALEYAQRAADVAPEPTPQILRDLAFAHHLAGDDATANQVAREALQLLDSEAGPDAAELRALLESDIRAYQAQ